MSLGNKTLFITGASRGIGLAIGLSAARDGANVVIAAKTAEPHKHLPGTIYSAAKEIEEAGAKEHPDETAPEVTQEGHRDTPECDEVWYTTEDWPDREDVDLDFHNDKGKEGGLPRLHGTAIGAMRTATTSRLPN